MSGTRSPVRRRWTAALVAASALAAPPVSGEEGVGEVIAQRAAPIYGVFTGGVFAGHESLGQLERPDAGLALGVGFGQRLGSRVLGELELLFALRNYDTPPLVGFADDEMNLESLHTLYSVKLLLATRRVQPFIGGGIGLTYTRLDIPSSIVPLASRLKEDEFGMAFQLVTGVEIAFKEPDARRFCIELRKLSSKADFHSVPGGDTEIGGTVYLFGYKRRL